MDYVIDTHTLIWAANDSHRLSSIAIVVLEDERNQLFVSAASAWEIATKVRLGKLPEATSLERNFLELVEQAGYRVLDISTEVALHAGRLRGAHKDPFDRIVAAQALVLGVPVVSKDEQFDALGVHRIW